MMENPVSRPIVPPIAESMSTNFAALSLVILSYVGVSKKILTNFSFGFHSYSEVNILLSTQKKFTLMPTFHPGRELCPLGVALVVLHLC